MSIARTKRENECRVAWVLFNPCGLSPAHLARYFIRLTTELELTLEEVEKIWREHEEEAEQE